jgi:hypothetical protein
VGKFSFAIPPQWKLILMLCTLVLPLFPSCGGGNAVQRKSTNEWLNSNIGIATVDDFISDMGVPQQSIETPEGTWYTWRKVKSGAGVSGGVGIGGGGGFFGIGMGAPVESGEELNCLFDRNTGRLRNYNHREW